MKRAHAVVDLETLDVVASAKIISIGVAFVTEESSSAVDAKFDKVHLLVDTGTNEQDDRATNERSMKWWLERPEKLRARELSGTLPLSYALGCLAGAMSGYDILGVWGNGAAFDNAIIRHACDQFGLPDPWSYKLDMCFRTLRWMNPDIEPSAPFIGMPHSAVDDAVHEARWLCAMAEAGRVKLF